MEVVARSAEEAFHKVINCINLHGGESAPRGKKIKEILSCCIQIDNPRDRIVSCPERKFNSSYAFGELLWYISGSNKLEDIAYYSSRMAQNSDDGITLNSAYGYRIFAGEHPKIGFNQWENVVRILKEDPDSRQAIIHLHTANDKKTRDEVCTLSLQFVIRQGKLNMITTMRSNDLYYGFVYDVFSFTMLQEMLANELGVELGKYHHNVGSIHVYEPEFSILMHHIKSTLPAMEAFDWTTADFRDQCAYERTLRETALECVPENDRAVRDLEEYLWECNDQVKHTATSSLEAFMKLSMVLRAARCGGCNILQNMALETMRERNETYSDIMQLACVFSRNGRKIVIEGSDAAGKTTKAYELVYDTGNTFQMQHYCKPSKGFAYFGNYMYNLQVDTDTIFDRFLFSEYVYSKVIRGNSREHISEQQLNTLVDSFSKKNTEFKFFIATNDEQLEIIKSRLSLHDEWLKQHVAALNEEYRKIADFFIEEGCAVQVIEIK